MTLLVTFFCLRGAGRRRAARPGLWATCRTPRLSGGGLAPPTSCGGRQRTACPVSSSRAAGRSTFRAPRLGPKRGPLQAVT